MLCVTYIILTSFGLVCCGLLAERSVSPGRERRWIWCAIVGISFVFPLVSRFAHTAGVARNQAHHPAGGVVHAFEGLEPFLSPFWLAASGLLLLWLAGNAWRVSRHLRRAVRIDGATTPGVAGVHAVVVSDAVGPATVGLWRPRIAVPRWALALPEAHRRYVLQHEEEHRRARDPLMIAAATIAVVLLPWNLGFWWSLRRLRLAIEMDCDARVVAALGDAQAYGRLLLRVAEAGVANRSVQPALLGGRGSLEQRLRVLLQPPQPDRRARFASALAACILLLAILAVPHPVWALP